MILFKKPTFFQAKTIFNLSLPILGGIISLNLLWLIDTAMIGRLGTISLAAVGFGGFLTWLAFSPFFGLVSAIQTITARKLGEKKRHQLVTALNSGLPFLFLLAVCLSIILIVVAPMLFSILSDDVAVVKEGTTYFQIRMIALSLFCINISFRGFWSGVKKPFVYFNFLYVIHLTNIFLNWVLIYGNLGAPALGSKGAAIATSISIGIGTLYYLFHGLIYLKKRGLFSSPVSFPTIKKIVSIGSPLSAEEMLYAASFTVFLSIIGKLGTIEVAITNVIRHISLFLFLPGRAFGVATASLVSESLGKKKILEASTWPWLSYKILIVFPITLGLIYMLFAKHILSIFIIDPVALNKAIPLLQIDAIHLWMEAIYLVFLGAFVGLGESKLILGLCILFQWCLFLPISYFIGPILGLGITAIWIAILCINAIKLISIMMIWHRHKWSTVKSI